MSLLGSTGTCSVDELADRFGVSGMTIRRDLQNLVDDGRVLRTHGGATLAENVTFQFQFLKRKHEHESAKAAIATAAAERVQDGQSILLDSGTTTLLLAERLRGRQDLTVVTTSLPIASALWSQEQIHVLLLGGHLRHGSPDLCGPVTESNLETLRADLAFIGADGIDTDGNAYNADPAVARMLGKMATAATQTYVVADASKIGRTALMRYGRIQAWAGLITDQSVDQAQLALLRSAGVNVIVGNEPAAAPRRRRGSDNLMKETKP